MLYNWEKQQILKFQWFKPTNVNKPMNWPTTSALLFATAGQGADRKREMDRMSNIESSSGKENEGSMWKALF